MCLIMTSVGICLSPNHGTEDKKYFNKSKVHLAKATIRNKMKWQERSGRKQRLL